MNHLTIVNIFGSNYYRLNVNSAARYFGGDFGSFTTAPIIHTYSARAESVSPRLAIRQDAQAIQIGNKRYQVKRFLTVQPLNYSLVTDEDGDFRPTVKPHYAIAPVNGRGTVYNQHCKTLITDDLGNEVENRTLPVHVHDGLLSPAVSLSNLRQQLLLAQGNEQSKFYTSYVVDEVNKQILVTQHCLLNKADHMLLCQTLDHMDTPSLEGLIAAETSIKDALVRLHQPVSADELSIKAVFSGSSRITPKQETKKPVVIEPSVITPKSEPEIDNEIARLETSKNGKGSFLVNIGVIEASDTKISALEELKVILKNGAIVGKNQDEFHEELRQWKATNWACITKQRNCIHSFFSPNHIPAAAKWVDDLFAGLNIPEKAPEKFMLSL